MRIIAIAYLLMGLIVSGVAADNGSKSAHESDCVATAHAHQYGDIRMALVEVSSVNQCGFSFVNLEEHTVGLSNEFQFANDFRVVKVEEKDKQVTALFDSALPHKAVKRGMCGLALYCMACKTVFSLRPYDLRNGAMLTINP